MTCTAKLIMGGVMLADISPARIVQAVDPCHFGIEAQAAQLAAFLAARAEVDDVMGGQSRWFTERPN